MKILFIFIVLLLLGSCSIGSSSESNPNISSEITGENTLEWPIRIQESEGQPNF